jgi:DegV family protein with EDD domain
MQNKVIITSDSTCDLSPLLLQKYQIDIVSLYVNFNDRSFKDDPNLTTDDISDYVAETKKLPTTSAATTLDYIKEFSKWTELGYDIVHINIGSGFSCTHQNACIAGLEFPNVIVVDSNNLSAGTGILVIKAAILRDKGFSGAEIAERLRKMVDNVHTSFIIDTLEYLHKGGRCSAVAAIGANLLRLKPCIQVVDGKMDVGKKYRGALNFVLEEYIKDKLSNQTNLVLDRIIITHSCTDTSTVDLVVNKIKSLALFEEILVTKAGNTIFSHCGPNTLGIIFVTE